MDLDPVDAVADSPLRRFFERGGGWVAGQFVLLACLLGLSVLHPGAGPALWRFAGVLVLIVAVAVAIAGTKALGRNLTPFPKPADHAKLVQHGIYAKIRHPLYTAVMLTGIGWALVWLIWPALLAAAALLPLPREILPGGRLPAPKVSAVSRIRDPHPPVHPLDQLISKGRSCLRCCVHLEISSPIFVSAPPRGPQTSPSAKPNSVAR